MGADETIYLGQARFNFRPIAELFGPSTATVLANHLVTACAGYAPGANKARHYALTRFLKWTAAEAQKGHEWANDFCQRMRSLQNEPVPYAAFRSAVDQWREQVADLSTEGVVGAKDKIGRQRALAQMIDTWNKAAGPTTWPRPGKLRPIIKGNVTGGNIPSLAELTRPGLPKTLGPKLWRELVDLNQERLAQLRSAAAAYLKAELAKFRRGRTLISRVPEPAADEEILILRLKRLGLKRLKGTQRPRRLDETRYEKALSEVLAYMAQAGGPVSAKSAHLAWQFRCLGGMRNIKSFLEGSPAGLVGAQTIVLIDTGINISVSKELSENPFVGTPRRGQVPISTVAGTKLRAGGKAVEADILPDGWIGTLKGPDGLSGREAILIWQEMSAPIRCRARSKNNEAADYLWIVARQHAGREIIDLCDDVFMLTHWRAFVASFADDPLIGGLPIQRRMIRPTVLQVRHVQGDFDQLVTQKIANHSTPAATSNYVGRAWLNSALDEKVRGFLDVFERTLASDVEDVASSLGVTEANWEKRKIEAFDTGIGFLCKSPTESPQPIVPKGQRCTLLDRCAECPSRRFVPSAEALKALALMKISLETNAASWVAIDPDRWTRGWLPMMALVLAIFQKLENSHRRFSLRKAVKEVKEGIDRGEITLVYLY